MPHSIAEASILTRCVLALAVGAAVGVGVRASAPTGVITADFSAPADYPLSKTKFGAYNSGLVPLAHYERDIQLYDEVRPNSLRIDLWWGGGKWTRPPVAGKPGNIEYHFDEMDRIAELLHAHDVLPYWAYCYVPAPLQLHPGDSRRILPNSALWGEVLGTFARHARQGPASLKIGYHEIYNEPDNRDFFLGTREDYFDLYREGSRAIRAADPDALIGGPAVAFTDAWVGPFLDLVIREKLPLDFFSFHYYPGVPWKGGTLAGVVAALRHELARRPQLATTEMHLNEFNSYPIDYPQGGRQDRHALAAALLRDYEFFLAQPDIAQVHWAQFQDTGGGNWSGMIGFGGHRKAVFNAAAILARMPVDRRQTTVPDVPGLGGMASAEAHRVGLVIWNVAERDQPVRVLLAALPFPRARLRVYRIDAQHSSWRDNPTSEPLTVAEERTGIATRSLDWSGRLPGGGVIYFELDDGTGLSELDPNRVARVVRTLRYYPNRLTRSYADFDCHTWIARLGMGPESGAHEQVGVVVEGLPAHLTVRVQTQGAMQQLDANSLLGLRLDYQVGTNYTGSVLFHGPCEGRVDLYDPKRDAPVPWGTRRQADRVVAVTDLSRFDFAPGHYAPVAWTGRAQIAFILQNAGPGTHAKMRVSAAH